mmetsp:Transcript_382/g.724  ORF Transcript_382/g.724 Transcript_382/m.724 type:complete len:419 (+) Transcript_382:198-1454(+)
MCLGFFLIQRSDFRGLRSHDGGHDLSGDEVRIGVGGWSTIFEVSLAFILCVTSNTDRGSTVGNTEGEIFDGGGFEFSGKTKFVSFSVDFNVFLVLFSKLVDGLLDDLKSTFLTHGLGGDVGVHTGSVPVSLNNRLRVEGAVDLEVFADTHEDVAGHHKLVSGINSDARSNLVFLLSRHDFSVDSRDVDSSVQAGLVQRVGDGTSKVVFGSNRAVVRSLRTAGHATLRPSERSAFVQVEEGEFLFQTEPDFFVFVSAEVLFGESTGVGGESLSGRSVGVAHDQDVTNSIISGAERILEDTLGLQDDFGVVTRGLVGRRTVEIPLGKRVNRLSLGSRQSAGFGSGVSDGVNPNVFGHDTVGWERKGVILGDDSRIQTGLTSNLSKDTVQGSALGLLRDRSKGHGGRGAGKSKDGSGELHG